MQTIEIRGSRLAYTVDGSGEPVVMVHCSSATGSEWNKLRAALGDGFRCITPDQWACGKSDPWRGDSAFTLAEEAAPLIELLDRLGTPVHLVGHSYGGGVALRVARARPQLIRSLTLIEPSTFHLLRHGAADLRALFEEIAAVAATVTGAVTSGDYWGGMARFVDYWNGAGAWEAMPFDARIKLSQRLAKVVLDFRALFEEPAGLDDYAALGLPTLLVCGENSPGPSRRIVELLHAALPNATVVRIPGAGHMSPLTHAEPVNTAIRDHVMRHATRSPASAAA
jgi:pimeloyl-ACP methyl ester carboxylesterase